MKKIKVLNDGSNQLVFNFISTNKCPICHGSGIILLPTGQYYGCTGSEICKACNGTGEEHREIVIGDNNEN